MNILYHHRIGSKDGQYVHIEELVAALRGEGHNILVVGPARFESQSFGGESGFVSWLKRHIPGAAYEFMEFLYNVIDYMRLHKAIRRFRPDFIYERYNLYLISGFFVARAFRLPLLVEVNAPLYEERSSFGGLSVPWLARWSEQKVWCGADRVFTVTHVLAEYLYKAGVARQNVVVTPNGINPDRFVHAVDRDAAKCRLGLEGRLILGFVGFAREWHGLSTVIGLLAEYRETAEIHFLMVGDGPARITLEQQARAMGIADRITITGVIDRDQITAYANAIDIALQPSVVPYASPLKLFEYMAIGSAIVAPSSANIREILTHEHDALLFAPGSEKSFGEAVQRLIKDVDLRKQLGAAAKKTLDDRNLTWADNAHRVTAVAADMGCGQFSESQSGTAG